MSKQLCNYVQFGGEVWGGGSAIHKFQV